jgi:hypothetical protein
MSKSWRVAGVLLGIVFLSTGCEKSSTTPPAGKPGDETYAKKLVGVWEGTEEGPKGDKPETATIEFKADNTMKIAAGPFEMKGTWKVVKEEGKTVTIDTEMSSPFDEPGKGPAKTKAMSFSIVFDDANNITMTPTYKNDPKKLKRKR